MTSADIGLDADLPVVNIFHLFHLILCIFKYSIYKTLSMELGSREVCTMLLRNSVVLAYLGCSESVYLHRHPASYAQTN